MSKPHTITSARTALGLAVALAMGATALPGAAHAQQNTGGTVQAEQHYDISAGPLSQVLNRFADQAGVALSFDAARLGQRRSGGLKGRFTVEQGFSRLLDGSGQIAREKSPGNYVIEATNDNRLDPVQVTTGRLGLSTENTGSYTTAQVGIGRTVESVRDIPQTVNVVTSQQMKDRNMTTLQDALGNTTGVSVKSYGTGTANYLIRGFETDAISIDGNQTGGTSSGTHGHGAPDLAGFERVEVLKGPAGLLQGSAEPGGYINLVRKRALAERAVSLTGFAHSWPGYRVQVDATGALTDDDRLRARTVVAYEDSDGYIDDVTLEKKVLYTTLEYDITDATTTSIGFSTEDVESVPDVGVPTYADGTFADIDRDLYTGAPFNNKSSRLSRAFVEVEHLFDNGVMLLASANRTERDFDYLLNYTVSPIDPVTGESTRWALATDQELEEQAYDVRLDMPVSLLGLNHDVLLGVHRRTSEDVSSGYQIDLNYPPINVFAPETASNPWPNLAPFSDPSTTEQEETGVYFKTTSSLTYATKLILGGRLTNWETDNGQDTERVSDEFTPYAGVVHELNNDLSLYASAAQSFVPQTAEKANGDILAPREGTQFEIGAKGVFNRGLTNYNLALFRITDDNRAIQDPGNPAFSVAGGKVRAQGVEAEIAGQVSERIQVLTGYAYTDTEQLESDDPNAEGKPFAPDSPEYSLKLWGKYTFNPSWEAGLGAQYSSGTFAESGGVRWEQNGYTTFSAMAAYNLNADTRFVLTGSNLTDKRYYSRVQGGGRQNYFGDARQFKLSFETRF